jgi:TRAP-type C4-dicarboxylate transport system permease small subunit
LTIPVLLSKLPKTYLEAFMVGMIQIVIYILCLYLIYKGVEIYQIAYVSNESEARKKGINTGIALVIIAVLAAGFFIYLSETMAAQIGNSLPSFNP